MIELYAGGGPNVAKVLIALEEMGLEYSEHVIDLRTGANFEHAFEAISPMSKIPAIVDHDVAGGKSHTVFESGAILIYLAERTGAYLPSDPLQRSKVVQWLMLQMASVGPFFGQFAHFQLYAPEIEYARDRYKTMIRNILDVIEHRLDQSGFIGGADYSIADMAFYPWINSLDFWLGEPAGDKFPRIAAWSDTLSARPALAKAMAANSETYHRLSSSAISKEAEDRLLGRGTYKRI